jgi:hypothetical protein
MGTRPAKAEKTAARALRGRHALLGAFIVLLNQIDNPMRRRAAKFRHEQRSRRDISVIRGPRIREISPPAQLSHRSPLVPFVVVMPPVAGFTKLESP